MRRLIMLGALVLATLVPSAPVHAQTCGPQNPNCVVPDRPVGDSTNAAANTRFVQQNAAGAVAGVASYAGRVGTVVPVTGDYSFVAVPGTAGIAGSLGFNQMPAIPANSVYGNVGPGAAGLALQLCNTPQSALQWTPGTGFGCNTNIMATVPVPSVFGRTGPITPATNDYDFPQIGPSKLALTQMSPLGANTLYGDMGAGAVGVPVVSCSGGNNALTWTTGSGFGCNPINIGIIESGTVGQIAWYDANGQEIAGNINLTISGGNVRVGVPGTTIGTMSFANQTSGTVAISPPGTGALGNSVLTMPARTGTLATTSGALTSGHCAQFDPNGNIADAGGACSTGGTGSGTVSGGANGQLAYYPGLGTTTTVSGNPNVTVVNGALTLGSAGVGGSLILDGANSGSITLLPLGTAGNNTLTLPAATGTVAILGSPSTAGQCAQFNSSGALISTGSPCGSGTGAGTVTSFSAGALSPLFTTSVATATTTPALSFSLSAVGPNTFLAGPASGATSLAPTQRALVSADVPPINLASSANGGVTGNLPAAQVTGSIPSTQISGLGTAATQNTGTTGATIPLNSGNNTYSGSANFTGSTFQIASNTMTFPTNAAIIPQTIAAGTVGLGVLAIAPGACAAAVNGTATVGNVANIQTTDVIQASFNGDPTGIVGYQPLSTGMLVIIPFPAAGGGNASFRVCNNTNASITPGAITLNWRVVR